MVLIFRFLDDSGIANKENEKRQRIFVPILTFLKD